MSSASGNDGAANQLELSPRTANARIAQVGARNAFVVIELGTADGVVVGNKFTISRNGTPVAEALVSSVDNSFTIGQIAPASMQSTLQVSDTASFIR